MSSDPEEGGEAPDNALFRLYRRYIGDPDAETDVYVGFALFFGGIALGAAGILVFFLSSTATGLTVYAYREVASVATAAALPVVLVGIVVLLPGDRRMLYAAVLGGVVCAAAIALFVSVYPYNWNVEGAADYSVQGVAIYAVGLVAVIGATGASLVGHQLQRASAGAGAAAGHDAGAAADEAGSTGESAADVESRAREDYESAMEGAEVTWGGVEKTETRRLELNTEAVDEVDRSSFDSVAAAEARGDSVDDAVSGLRSLQGRESTKTGTGGGTDDQMAALTELRERQREQQEAEPDGVVDRVRSLFGSGD